MIVFPAIDLYEQQVVRLLKGDYQNKTVYSDRPLSIARDFEKCGATHIHMVDLQGARDGGTPNLPAVEQIAKETGLFVEIGGGIRNMQTAERYFAAGVDRVILGTAAVEDEAFLKDAVQKWGDKIAVGADVRDGYIAVKGWQQVADLSLEQFLAKMQALQVRYVICTDISKDGAMQGTNLSLYRELSRKYAMHLTASGGVSSLEDIRALRQMELYGAIIGKAYYTGAIDLKQAIEVAK